MSEKMYPIPFRSLMNWVVTEYADCGEIFGIHKAYRAEDRRRCAECGAVFASTSNSVKYCPDCRKRITRRQAAERMRKRRARVTQ